MSEKSKHDDAGASGSDPRSSSEARKSNPINYDRIPPTACSVVTELKAQPGKEGQLRSASIAVVVAVRRNPDNIGYFCQEDQQSQGRFIFFEIWPSQSAFEAHNTMPEVKAFYASLRGLAVHEPAPIKLNMVA